MPGIQELSEDIGLRSLLNLCKKDTPFQVGLGIRTHDLVEESPGEPIPIVKTQAVHRGCSYLSLFSGFWRDHSERHRQKLQFSLLGTYEGTAER